MLTQNPSIPRILPLNREILQNPVPLPTPPANPVHAALHHVLGLAGKKNQIGEQTIHAPASMADTIIIEPVRIPTLRPQSAPTAIPANSKLAPALGQPAAGAHFISPKLSSPSVSSKFKPFPASPASLSDTVWIEPFLARMTPAQLSIAPAVNRLKTRATEIQSRANKIKARASKPIIIAPQPEFKISYSFGDTHALHTIRTGHVHRFVAPHQRDNPDVRTALSLLDAGMNTHQLAGKMGARNARRVLRTIQAAANRKEWHAARHAK